MNARMLLIGAAAATLFASPALAAPPSPATTPAPATVTASATTAPKAVSGKVIEARATSHESLYKRAQEKLKAMNMYAGPVDGKRSPVFVKAIEGFQSAHKLKASGRLNHKTQKALGI